MDRALQQDSPLTMKISFNTLMQRYETLLEETNDVDLLEHGRKVLALGEEYPELREGITNMDRLTELKPQIDLVLRDSFSSVLTENEIKTAGIPFEGLIFKSSKRFDNIMANAPEGFNLEVRNMPEGHIYIMACSVILKAHYNVDVQFRRPLYYDIPDKNGVMKHYRITYNADFVELNPTERSLELTPKDIDELIDGFDNLELWKEKFPPGSWEFKGFVIANMFDVTLDSAISELKTWLLNTNSNEFLGLKIFENIFQSLFNVEGLQIGFINYDEDLDTFEKIGKNVPCFMLQESNEHCESQMCLQFRENILKQRAFFAISDIEKYYTLSGQKEPYASYYHQGFKSVILAPVTHDEKLLGVLELLSPRKKELNSVNANKLIDVMPFIVAAGIRTKQEKKNQIEAIIQSEYTSLHRSVRWKFVQEAKRYLKETAMGNPASLKEVAFKHVYPLYGQIDIKNSSDARNSAARKDLGNQLSDLKRLFESGLKERELPIFEEYIFRLDSYLDEVKNRFKTNTEQGIVDFLNEEIHPALQTIEKFGGRYSKQLQLYRGQLNEHLGMYYSARERYDNTVKKINKEMARVIDEKHEEAYAMFPHYFERYKTDGVEHNMYIGQSIAPKHRFDEVYLQNLKLWQLQTMCHMENVYYNLKPDLDIPLDVTSLLLVHSTPLSIKFRMDEKHFDVDGTYNARYEIIKKRIDKAHIKGTKKRITQPGKMTIIYTLKQDEQEYMRYVRLLQAKGILSQDVTRHELEELQGVSGLKAISVGILYKKNSEERLLSYEELIDSISN
ncbi:GAF domain-containing protein [Robertkochia marina]|uniref:GAF domain-containing protein n=1 Tax=Robertkochia marina TaxID=1227945 RepID=A0A4S3M4X3_9FLAO|nr:GAF domain-containing protein [Robertkochia marina]THD69739.1 GAF domain-containing protein [Robertkochia marina]TRZ46917.1 GAF domain-containing protein [Robertkochia marina]